MIATLRWILFVLGFMVLGAGAGILLRMLTGRQEPLWTIGAAVLSGLLGVLAAPYAVRRGWLRSFRGTRAAQASRRRKLAEERERLIEPR